ncbi:MAG: DegT/DnrJ/EryC1/StrS family aminotransferase [Atopobiaceae bacterium]|jgi:dTDP-4-amino-4,6-dideoxygalactose transaminase|nr:DegT/DnrJ/EryC1/StrS family aminotransferase [Atopobiaceae bacterium]MCI2173741.1 DegT/DnrJ/EryC1/StrS family aminotransferase [Atopobiaceae bacterium]MCI2207617.1 DegT/DnrJ/EryC1/StrS family aminotransferase [Atopobiaceae bacterium]
MPDNKQILVTRSSMPPLDEYVAEIAPLWESHWLTNMGEKHRELERELESYLGVDDIALFVNGHSALECVLEAMQLKGKVITTPYSFASTTHAIVRKGLTPVFADIKPDDYTIDPSSIESLIDEDTCAIVPVHVYGNLCDVEAIQDIADRHHLKVVYDAAHAFGVRLNGASSATFGDAAMFSFHATKVFNTIEGGAVCFREPGFRTKLNQWKNFGITGEETVEYVGGNAKMNEFCAAMGICNLRHLDDEIAKRKMVAERYWERLDGARGVRTCLPKEGVTPNYAYMPVVFEDEFGSTRDAVFDALAEQDIHARKYFYPLISDYGCYAGRFDSSATPVAKHVAARVLTLPMYADLAVEDVDRICDIVLSQASE